MPNPPVPPGIKVDKSSDYFRYWPQGRPALAKLNDNLTLAIPPQYQQFWRQPREMVRAPARPDQIPLAPAVGFSFFLPDFSGYTPNNYKITFDPDRVDIDSLESSDPRQAELDAPGAYPPNMLKRVLEAGVKGEPQEMYGLTCYRSNGDFQNILTCYAPTDESIGEYIMLRVDVPPFDSYTRFPLVHAMYFTKRYGGLQIIWNTHSKNFPRWRDIDAQIWKFIDSWNIAGSAKPDTKP